jgi:5'-methylthioadenosine phosphorylase
MTARIPQTPFALISGSAGWGVRFPDDLDQPGVGVVERGLTFDTPWGATENWQLVEIAATLTADGQPRRFLNVFTHGWPLDAIDHSAHRRVAWVLAQAGVRKIVADSTCGSLNKVLQPRDFIIPVDLIDFSQTQHSLLAGRFRHVCLADQLFCPSLAATLERVARQHWPAPGRVLGHGKQIVIAHDWGPRFASRAESRAFQLLGADAMNQSICPEAGSAREIGACFASASYVVCYEPGIATADDDLDAIHGDLALPASRISLQAMIAASLSDECGCARLRVERPSDYATVAQGGRRRS